jgi:hypothetical protein
MREVVATNFHRTKIQPVPGCVPFRSSTQRRVLAHGHQSSNAGLIAEIHLGFSGINREPREIHERF